ncbi:MAG: hypothetical protein QW304_03390 [Thermoproteota archaeon]
MGRSLQLALTLGEIVVSLFIFIPTLLWLLLNFYYIKHKIGRNRKKMLEALKREGLPEPVSVEIAKHIFPEIELSPWKLSSFFVMNTWKKRANLVGKHDRRAYQED